MVTINLSLRDTALIVEALEAYRADHQKAYFEAAGKDEQNVHMGYLNSLDALLNRTLDAGEPVVYDALGMRMPRR